MASNPSESGDPMAREVERLLAQLDRKHSPPAPREVRPAAPEERPAPAPQATITWATTPAPAVTASPVARVTELPTYDSTALWGRVLLGVSLGLMMTAWPYIHRCGWPLLGYGVAVTAVLITGAWIALAAWKQHNGPAHLLALFLFYWGLVLAAEQLLPRIGYAGDDASCTCGPTP